MRKIFMVMLLLLVAVTAHAADRTGHMMRDKGLDPVPGPSPNGALTQALTVASTTIDLTGSLWYAIYAPSATCKVRLMPAANSTKATYKQFTTPAATWTERWVKKDTPFMNISGCTSGELQRQ